MLILDSILSVISLSYKSTHLVGGKKVKIVQIHLWYNSVYRSLVQVALAISVLHDDFLEHCAVQLLLSNACQQQLMYKSTGFSNRFNNHNWTSFFFHLVQLFSLIPFVLQISLFFIVMYFLKCQFPQESTRL